ncbi:MAG TPA: CPCC family cysteine-rich protein [Rhizomicrobium sp.]|nr:CPCC family cysteine-rich protein [Rhizomicrobium sp.]
MNVLLPCLCCASRTIRERGAFEICPVCGWEDDPSQAADENLAGGANVQTLAQARAAWLNRSRTQGD